MAVIRRFQPHEVQAVFQLIDTTMHTVNIKDYSLESIEAFLTELSPEALLERAKHIHFYVVCEGEEIIGCGGIGPYWGSETESSLFTVFIHPAHQGKGLGRRLIETLEQDEYFLRAARVEVPASITAVNFYRKMGYDFKNGVDHPDEEQLFRLEKFR